MSIKDEISDKELFEEFFDAMLTRIQEKQKVYGDSWKYCADYHLKILLSDKFGSLYEIMKRNLTLPEGKKLDETKLLIDVANFVMFLWLRHKKQFKGEE